MGHKVVYNEGHNETEGQPDSLVVYNEGHNEKHDEGPSVGHNDNGMAEPQDALVVHKVASVNADLTERRIAEAIKTAPAGAEMRLYDRKLPGLVLWRRASSKPRSSPRAPGGPRRPDPKPRWYIFRRVAGQKLRVPLAQPSDWPAVSLQAARALAPVILAQWASGCDISAVRKAKRSAAAAERSARRAGAAPTLDVLESLLCRLRERGRTERHVDEVERIGRALAHKVPDLGQPDACPVAEAWLRKMSCSSLTRHRYGAHTKALGAWAIAKRVRWPRLSFDPFAGLEVGCSTLPAPAMFTLPELFALASDEAMGTAWGRLFSFLLFTGARFREGAYSRWGRIDLAAATFAVLPPTAAEREAGEAVKRDKGRTVYLQPELVDLLRQWPRHGDFLFPSPVQTTSGDSTLAFRAHLSHLGIAVAGRRIHTLRHAHVALSVACGVEDMRLRLSVGHGGPEMTRHYANAAMLWRGQLRNWTGTFRLRDPAERARLAPLAVAAPKPVKSSA